jgi:predicted dienelactone hydrolase
MPVGRRSLWIWLCAIVVAHSGVALAANARTTGRFAVGKIVIHFRDPSRLVTFPGQRPVPRPLTTVIRYPAAGDPSRTDIRDAPPARTAGPFPLIVFAHGFNVTPATYASLMRAWTRAGYVVAAPVFPLTNANTPGGANESDLVNQPRDMSFVISRLLARDAARYSVLHRLINSHEIAVSGQSDGGSTALAVAYNSHFADHRIRAAMILSGAEIPGLGGYDFPAPSPPLLAVQGTADSSNAPASTYRYFDVAPQPKFLLTLLGAGHLPPYTTQQPQLTIVERETIAFLDRYLKRLPGARSRMWKDARVPGVATFTN